MKPYTVTVFALCIFGALAEDSGNTYYGSVREVFNLYNECSNSDGLTPCLKLKALSLIERVSRMEKINLLDGVVISGQTEAENLPSLEEEEKNLPRALDAKNQALTGMIVNRIARMIGSKTIEVSIPKLIESARGKDDDSKFGDLEGLFDKFGDSDKKGGHGGGHGGGGGKMKGGKKKKGGLDMKDFLMMVMAHKLAMIPLLIGGLFVLALKALTQAKVALLIAGIIFAKKMLANRNNGGHVEHVHAAPSTGGWAGGAGGGWAGGAGGGWDGGWDKRSIEETHNLAYQAQKQ